MTVFAVFQVLLQAESGQDDLVVGSDIANRNHLETEGLIGFFVNQLALRTRLEGDPRFRELLARVREDLLGDYAHQDLPFDRLIQALNPERGGLHPLFQIKLNLVNVPAVAAIGELAASPVAVPEPAAKLDLIVDVLEAPTDLFFVCHYNRGLFDVRTIERLLDRFQALIAAAVSRPEARLSELRDTLQELEREEMERHRQKLQEARRRRLRQATPHTPISQDSRSQS
jgi:non-ribosomal peptide synthetase component F